MPCNCTAARRGRERILRRQNSTRDASGNNHQRSHGVYTVAMPPFSISESLKFGWEKLRNNSGLLLPVALVLAVLQIINRFDADFLAPSAALYAAQFFIFALEVMLGTGALVIMLRVARGEEASMRDIIPPGRLLARVLIAELLLVLLVLGIMFGTALVGIVVWFGLAAVAPLRYAIVALVALAGLAALAVILVKYFFLQYTAIDLSLANPQAPFNGRATLAQAGALTVGIRWRVLLFLIVYALIYALGALTVIGLLITIPLTYLASASVYLKLKERVAAASIEQAAQK